jgi:hypothetical protein
MTFGERLKCTVRTIRPWDGARHLACDLADFSGGDVRLRLRGREAKICVDWLTGEAQLGEHC